MKPGEYLGISLLKIIYLHRGEAALHTHWREHDKKQLYKVK